MKTRTRRQRFRHSRKRKDTRLKNWGFGTILIIVAGITASVIVGKILAHKFMHRKTPSVLVASEWKRYSPGDSRLSLELPGEPQPGNVEVPESMRATTKQVSRYEYSTKGFNVAVWEASYFDGVPTDIQRAAEGAASALKQSEGITDYRDGVTPITRSGLPGSLITGEFKKYDEKQEIRALLLADGPKLWQVIITYAVPNRTASVASQRVLDSIQIQPKSSASG